MNKAADDTFSVTPEAIRARVDAAHRLMELAQSMHLAEAIRDAVALAYAEASAASEDVTSMLSEFRKAAAAFVYAEAVYQQAMDELARCRVVVRLTA